jgi:hypothetical protein
MPALAGVKNVLDDLGAKNPKVREIKPEDLFDTRFLCELKLKDIPAGAQKQKD